MLNGIAMDEVAVFQNKMNASRGGFLCIYFYYLRKNFFITIILL